MPEHSTLVAGVPGSGFWSATAAAFRTRGEGSRGGTGTVMAGASVPPSTSNTLPVTQELASETR